MPAPTSNIKGTFKDSKGVARAGITIALEPLDTPFTSGGDIIVSGSLFVTLNNDGQFGYTSLGQDAVTVVRGNYRVVVSNADSFIVSVPGDGGEHDLKDIKKDDGETTTLRDVVSATDLGSVIVNSTTIEKTLKTDPYAERSRIVVFGEGTILPDYRLFRQLQSLDADEIISLGNANPGGLDSTIDSNIGEVFHDYILSYSGAHGAGATGGRNNFWYALGEQDWIPGNVDAVTDFFTFPNNERYYKTSLINDVVELFVLDSEADEPDGVAVGTTQANWLQAQLAASTARFKIVALGRAYKASKTGYSYPATNLPFASWGANLVLWGGAKIYERIFENGINHVLVGTASDDDLTMDTIGTPVSGSVVQGNSPGLFVIDYNGNSLNCVFIDWNGALSDIFTIQGQDTTNVSLYSKIWRDHGIKSDLTGNGLMLDIGSATNQALSGPDLWTKIQGDRIIRRNVPTTTELREFPWLASCIIMAGDDPCTLWYWNKSNQSWDILLTAPTASYWSGARTTLAIPVLSPSSGSSACVAITHELSDVEIYYSVNGEDFQQLSTFPTDGRVFYGAPGNWWLAAFARKTGFLDSDVVWGSFSTPFLQNF